MLSILFRPQFFSPLPSVAMFPLCGVRAIYILAMFISGSIFDFHWPPMLEISCWNWNVLTWVVWAPCTVGFMASDTQCWPGTCATDGISFGFGFRSGFGMLWFGVCTADRGAFLIRRDSYTVVACAKFRCDQWGTFRAGSRQILIEFRVRSRYRWWDGRQSCEICTFT